MKSRWYLSLACFAMLFSVERGFALPKVGSVAPKLKFAKMLQSPSGARVDWASLRGKTVVLEFWATWCAPCVKSIPHLNDLFAAVDPNKVVFISIDDEDGQTIESFASKRKMAGWIALDPDHSTFKAYGVVERPATVVVDGAGRVASVASAEELTAARLMSWSRANLPAGSSAMTHTRLAAARVTASEPAPPPLKLRSQADKLPSLFEISLSPSPNGNSSSFQMNHDRAGNFWWYGVNEDFLLQQAFDVPLRRFIFQGPKEEGEFDLALQIDGLDRSVVAPVVQAAVRKALKIEVSEMDILEDALAIKGALRTSSSLRPTASSATPQYAGVDGGKFVAINSTLRDIAEALESYAGLPVLDESEIPGAFDVEFALSSKDPQDVMKAVSSALGIIVERENRKVPTYTVTQSR